MSITHTKKRGSRKPAAPDQSVEDLSAEDRRKRKSYELRRRIRQEWEETERGYRENQPRNPANFPTLDQLAEAAGLDYRNNGRTYGERQKTFYFYWKPATCDQIKVAYYLSRFSSVVLLPPKRCYHTRLAAGLPVKEPDEWEKRLVDYLDSPEAAEKYWLTTKDLLIRVLNVDEAQITRKDQGAIGRIMKKLDWKRRRETVRPRRWGYSRPDNSPK